MQNAALQKDYVDVQGFFILFIVAKDKVCMSYWNAATYPSERKTTCTGETVVFGATF